MGFEFRNAGGLFRNIHLLSFFLHFLLTPHCTASLLRLKSPPPRIATATMSRSPRFARRRTGSLPDHEVLSLLVLRGWFSGILCARLRELNHIV